MPIDAVFNANEFKPTQFGGGSHPIGNKFPFTITNTNVSPTKDNQNGMFVVELTSPAGSIKLNLNLFHSTSEQARNIAKGQLATLCHAVGISTVDFKNDGAALRGGVGLMDIGFQKGQEPSAEKPEGGYVEVKKIYDKNGNDPTQGGSGQQQQNNNSGFSQQSQNNAANQTSNWNTGNQQQSNNTTQQPNVQSGWNGGQQSNQPDPNQNQQQNNQGGGWNAGSNQTQGNTPPWQK